MPGLNEVVESAKGAGGSGRMYAKLKATWTEAVWARALAARLRPMKRVRLRFEWRERDRRRDPDNVASAKKFVLDGLVSARVIPGDGWAHVAGWDDVFEVVERNPGVAISLTEVENA